MLKEKNEAEGFLIVNKTKDYKMFQLLKYNRDIMQGKVESLARAIQQRNLLKYCPILVDENMAVIDGQHRLKAAESLGYHVWYLIVEDYEKTDIVLLNTKQNRWKVSDYLKLWSMEEKAEYQRVVDLMEKYGIRTDMILTVFAKSGSKGSKAFKEGFFETTERGVIFCERYAKFRDDIFQVMDQKGRAVITDRRFIEAMVTFHREYPNGFVFLLDALKKFPEKLSKLGSLEGYLKFFEIMYNRHRSSGNRIKVIQERRQFRIVKESLLSNALSDTDSNSHS